MAWQIYVKAKIWILLIDNIIDYVKMINSSEYIKEQVLDGKYRYKIVYMIKLRLEVMQE